MNYKALSCLTPLKLTLIGGGFSIISSLGLNVPMASAAETIVMKYGPIQRSLPVQDLRQLSDTGKPTRKLRRYLSLAKQSPESLRARLTEPHKISVVALDSRLNSVAGGLLLDEAGRYIHPPGQQGSRQALRSALILSASDDNQITLLESLENYPTQVVEVEVDKSVALYRRIDGVLNTGGSAASPIIDFIQKRIRSLIK